MESRILPLAVRLMLYLAIGLSLIFSGGLCWDTVNAFVNPEEYRNIHYKNDWIKEGFVSYILGNLIFLAGGLFFCLSAFNVLRGKGMVWKIIVSTIILFVIIGLVYRQIMSEM